MKLQPPKEYWKNRGTPPPISYKDDATIGKTLTENSDYLKVDIKTQPRERDSKTVEIYVPRFRMRISEALLNFVTLLCNII